MHWDIDLALLRSFVAIVDTGGITRAGQLVGRSQPAVSHQLKRLEQCVGKPLFGAQKRDLTLTRDGEILLQYARQMLRLNDEARARFERPDMRGHVTLGMPDLYAAYLLPDVLRSFSEVYPQIEIELRCRRSADLRAGLKSGEIDLAVVTKDDLRAEGHCVRHEPLVWVAAHTAYPERETILPLALLPAVSLYRQRAVEALRAVNRPWKVVSISDSIAGLQAAVFAGLAVSVVPRCSVSPALRILGPGEGMPALASIELMLLQKPQGLTAAGEQMAIHIQSKLETIDAFRTHEGPRVITRSNE